MALEPDTSKADDARWAAEHRLRERELALRERDHELRRDEVDEITDTEFSYPCRLGPGSGGAPIFSADGSTMIGTHVRRGEPGGAEASWALRADRIRAGSARLAARDSKQTAGTGSPP